MYRQWQNSAGRKGPQRTSSRRDRQAWVWGWQEREPGKQGTQVIHTGGRMKGGSMGEEGWAGEGDGKGEQAGSSRRNVMLVAGRQVEKGRRQNQIHSR